MFGPFAGRLLAPVGLIGRGCFVLVVGPGFFGWSGLAPINCPGKYGGGLSQIWGQIGGRVGLAGVGPGLHDWPGLAPFDWAGAGWVGPRSCPGRCKTGGFCNTFPHKNGPKTDTRGMRTRVNPVILYGHTVILRVKKSITQLRISEKKFGRKKCLGWQGKNSLFLATAGKLCRNFLLTAFIFPPKYWATSIDVCQHGRKLLQPVAACSRPSQQADGLPALLICLQMALAGRSTSRLDCFSKSYQARRFSKKLAWRQAAAISSTIFCTSLICGKPGA